MDREIFENELRKKVSQITFSGHRVNDTYSLNKRKAIMKVVMSAFDEAAQHRVQADATNIDDPHGFVRLQELEDQENDNPFTW